MDGKAREGERVGSERINRPYLKNAGDTPAATAKIDTLKIISGGQTGVDRAALDVALKHRIPCGGWCPEGRRDEEGEIPERYPMTELKKGGPDERTARNVHDSDGTIVIYFHELSGGTAYTVGCCIEQRQPHRLIDAAKYSPEDAVPLMAAFMRDHDIDSLNIAGPRQSEWAGGYDYTFRAVDVLLSRMKFSARRR